MIRRQIQKLTSLFRHYDAETQRLAFIIDELLQADKMVMKVRRKKRDGCRYWFHDGTQCGKKPAGSSTGWKCREHRNKAHRG